MRSSSAKPLNRNSNSPQGASTARASTSVVNGGSSSRTPSVPPTSARTVNKKYANVKSRIEASSEHTPQKSSVRIFHQPVKFNVTSRVGSMQNASHMPGGGNLRIESHRLNYKESAKPRIEAKATVEIPKSDKKIPTQKLQWNAKSKIGSLENAAHKPTGGDVKIFNEAPKFNVSSKIGSLDNANHVPGGGSLKISDYTVPSPRSNGNGGSRSSNDDSRRSSTANRGEL